MKEICDFCGKFKSTYDAKDKTGQVIRRYCSFCKGLIDAEVERLKEQKAQSANA